MQENRCYLGLLMTPFLRHINNALPAHNLPRGRTAFQLKRQQQNYLHYIFKIPISIYCKRGIFPCGKKSRNNVSCPSSIPLSSFSDVMYYQAFRIACFQIAMFEPSLLQKQQNKAGCNNKQPAKYVFSIYASHDHQVLNYITAKSSTFACILLSKIQWQQDCKQQNCIQQGLHLALDVVEHAKRNLFFASGGRTCSSTSRSSSLCC